MSGIRFITNTVWRDAAKVYSYNPFVLGGDMSNLVGGPLHTGAKFKDSASGLYHFGYIKNGSYTLAADAFVWIGGASLLTGSHDYNLKWAGAGGLTTIDPTETPADWNMTDDNALVGKDGDDLILTFAEVTTAEGFFFGPKTTPSSALDEWASLIYFGKSVLFDYPNACSVQGVRQTVRASMESYEIDKVIQLSFEGVTRADITAFEAQYKIFEQPMCIYDSAGNRFSEKLIVCLLASFVPTPITDDLFEINATFYGLKKYGSILR